MDRKKTKVFCIIIGLLAAAWPATRNYLASQELNSIRALEARPINYGYVNESVRLTSSQRQTLLEKLKWEHSLFGFTGERMLAALFRDDKYPLVCLDGARRIELRDSDGPMRPVLVLKPACGVAEFSGRFSARTDIVGLELMNFETEIFPPKSISKQR